MREPAPSADVVVSASSRFRIGDQVRVRYPRLGPTLTLRRDGATQHEFCAALSGDVLIVIDLTGPEAGDLVLVELIKPRDRRFTGIAVAATFERVPRA